MADPDDHVRGAGAVAFSSSRGDRVGVGFPADALDDAGLARLAARHDLALDLATTATFELDAATGSLEWSTTAAEVLGCPESDVEGHLRELLATVAAAPAELAAAYELEHRIITRSGTERFVQLRARSWPAVDRAGRDRILGAVVDVTDRRRTERELVDLIDRYRLLVELSPDAIVVHEAGIIRYANTATARMAGTTTAAMVGTAILPYLDPEGAGEVLARIASLSEAGMASEPTDATLLAVDGRQVRLEAVSVRTTWEGRPAYQVIMRDTSERDRAAAALRAQANLVAAVSDAIVAIDADDVVTSWNPAAERLFRWPAAEAVGRRLERLGDPFVHEARGHFRELLAGDDRWSGELTLARRDGGTVPVHASLATIPPGPDGAGGIVAVCSDQSQRRAAEAERARAEARFSTVVAALDEGIAVVGREGQVQSLNEAALHILGRSPAQVAASIVTGDGLDARGGDGHPLAVPEWPVQLAWQVDGPVRDRTVGIRRPDGRRVWLRMNVHTLAAEGPGTASTAVVCSFSDITEERRAVAELAYAASHDALTGLPNRAAMTAELDRVLSAPADAGEGAVGAGGRPSVAVLFCDLDRFKDVNDSLGHQVGDTVLCEVANRLRHLVPDTMSVGRLGGDEFIVVGAGVGRASAVDLAHRLVAAMEQPLQFHVHGAGMTVTLGASVGLAIAGAGAGVGAGAGRDGALYDDDEVLVAATGPPEGSASDLLRAADVALFHAKARGRARVEVYDPSMRDAARLRFQMREDLRVAIEVGQLDVHYQPLWQPGPEPGSWVAVGVEALARWHHPTLGPQSPADFVALAEETGLIATLGVYVLERACAQTAAWRAEGRDLYVSVNLSARQVSDPHLVATVAAVLDRTGLPAGALWLELTESALADETIDAGAVLGDLVRLGVRISIDDFGTGYSSLGRLRHLPVSALKVDRSFVADMTPESALDGVGDGGTIVESTIALAHRLGLVVVAEGVETEAQLDALRAIDCDIIQGFLLGRPVPAGQLPHRLTRPPS